MPARSGWDRFGSVRFRVLGTVFNPVRFGRRFGSQVFIIGAGSFRFVSVLASVRFGSFHPGLGY